MNPNQHGLHHDGEDLNNPESDFAPLTDLFISIAFIFLILMAIFSDRLQQASFLTDTRTRDIIIERIKDEMKMEGYTLTSTPNGVIRFEGHDLFKMAQANLDSSRNEAGHKAITALIRVFKNVLPCFVEHPAVSGESLESNPKCAWVPPSSPGKIATILIEGHADKARIYPPGIMEPFLNVCIKTNKQLSALRAQSVYDMIQSDADLVQALWDQPIFGFAGYGDTRPIVEEKEVERDEKRWAKGLKREAKGECDSARTDNDQMVETNPNLRVEFRVIMAPPKLEDYPS